MHVPQAAESERMVEQVVDVPMPGVDPVIEMPQLLANDRVSTQEQVLVQETPAGGGQKASSSSVPWRPQRYSSWRQAVDGDGRVYYWNVYTRESQWQLPVEIPPVLSESEEEEEEDEEELGAEEMDLDAQPSRFTGHLRPRRFCLPFIAGHCRRGSTCTFAHARHELHPDVQ